MALLPAGPYGLTTFHEANSAGRIYALQSLWEDGTWSFNELMCRYGPKHSLLDVSSVDGRAVLQKSPGLSWLGLPAYALLNTFHGGGHLPFHWLSTWLGLLVCVLGLFACAWFVAGKLSEGYGQRAALIAVVAWIAGSPQWVYAPLFQDYALLPALLIAGWFLIRDQRPACHVLGGLVLGIAGTVNYLGFVYAALLGTVALIQRLWSKQQPWPWLLRSVAGGAGPVLAILAYHWWVFGSPFHSPYGFLHSQRHLDDLAQASFSAASVFQQFLGTRHGVLLFAPWCVAGLTGLVALAFGRTGQRRVDGIAGLLVTGIAFGYTAHSISVATDAEAFSRHLSPTFPFLAVGLAFVLQGLLEMSPTRKIGQWLTPVAVSLVLVGIGYAFVTSWTYPYHPEVLVSPWWQLNWPMFLEGTHVPWPVFLTTPETSSAGPVDPARWTAILFTGSAILAALVAAWWNGPPVREGGRSAALAIFLGLSVTALFAAAGARTDPLASADVEAALADDSAEGWTGTPKELEALKKTADAAARERKLATWDVVKSRTMPLDPLWKPEGYPQNPWCRKGR
jgi:hypothetical protein